MIYNVWLSTERGKPSPFGPSKLYAPTLPDAQRKVAATLETLQQNGALVGWSVVTVTEAC